VAGLQSPDLTSSTRMSQPVSRSSPQHAHSHAQSVRVPGGLQQNTADMDPGWFDSALNCHSSAMYEGHSKSSYSDTVREKIFRSYFATFQHIFLQLKCTWSSISPKLMFHCRKNVDLHFLSSNLPC